MQSGCHVGQKFTIIIAIFNLKTQNINLKKILFTKYIFLKLSIKLFYHNNQPKLNVLLNYFCRLVKINATLAFSNNLN